MFLIRRNLLGGTLLLPILFPSLAQAQDLSSLDTGDTAWILTSSALVLFMTIPGLALFLCGLGSRPKCALGFNALFCPYCVDECYLAVGRI